MVFHKTAFFLLIVKYFHHSKLLIGNRQNSNVPFFRLMFFNSFYINVFIFHAGTMAYINQKLEHGKSILHQFFTKMCVSFFSFAVSVGRSKKTRIHIILYSLNLIIRCREWSVTIPKRNLQISDRSLASIRLIGSKRADRSLRLDKESFLIYLQNILQATEGWLTK